MSADWQKAKQIFNSVLETPESGRAEHLAKLCSGDDELRQDVEKLLAAYRTDFLENSFVDTKEMASASTRLTPGQKISHYEITRTLGAGGMGEVYLARDLVLDRHVAIKMITANGVASDEARQRLLREARAAAALDHQNICSIYEVGENDGAPFIAMQFIDGETLAARLKAGPLEVGEALRLAIQIAEALAAANERGIIHRDIKPENVMLTKAGGAKVMDFGLAKAADARASGAEDKTRTQVTQPGMILGTPVYMSPEQAKGERLDARSDIFSLGALLYEMLSGRKAFDAGSTAEVLVAILTREPKPLTGHSRNIPAELQDVISKMLSKDRNARFGSMTEVVAELKRCRDALSDVKEAATITFPNNDKKRRRGWISIAAASITGAVVIALAYTFFFQPSSRTAVPQITSLAVLPLENLSGDPSQEYFADGMTEALISNLSQIRELKVISRTSVMRYKSDRPPLPDIAKALGVDAIIEGSVVKSGNRVRITAQLIHGTSDAHLWARNYEREISDILKLQSDVAQAVASEIRVRLTPAEQTRLASAKTVDPRAHEAYLLGKFHLAKTNESDIERAISYFESAIAIEPDYADAHAALAAAWLDLGIWGAPSLAEVESKVRESAAAAIRIDPGNAKARIAMCQLLNNYDYNWTAAEDEARRALELDPNDPEVLVTYSWLLQSLGRHDEVRLKMEKAVQLDPISARVQSAFGRMLYRARDYERAEIQLKRSIDLQPTSYGSYGRLADVYIEMGRFDDALAQLEKSNSIQPDGAHALRRAVVYARMGDRAKAMQALTGISHQSAWEMARLHTALGEATKAFEILNAAVDRRDTLLVHLKEDPSFVPLHSDPRWKPILRRLNFPDV